MAASTHDCGKNQSADGAAIGTSFGSGGGNTSCTSSGGNVFKRTAALYGTPSDTACYEFAARSAVAGYVQMGVSGTYVAATGGAAGCWLMIDQAFTANVQAVRTGASSANFVGITAGNKVILVVNNAVVFTSAATLAVGRWYWISHSATSNAAAGTASVGLWNVRGDQLDTFTATMQNTSGIASALGQFGKISAAGDSGLYRVSSLRANNDAATLIPPPVPRGARGWGLAA